MASPAFKQSFARFPNVPIKMAIEKTMIKIIDLNGASKNVDDLPWARELAGEGINISYMAHPCQLNNLVGDHGDIAEIETKHVFSKGMWAKVQANKIAGAICISHLRCLHEMLTMNPEGNTFIVLEGDVTSHGNTHQLMSAFLANWHGNEHLKDTWYCALTFSDWHSGYSQELRNRGEVVPGSIIAPYFKIVSLPMKKGYNDSYRYSFVGQGARAICYNKDFAQEIIGKVVNNYYDLHLLDVLSHRANVQYGVDGKNYKKFLACVVDPPMFEHIPSFEKRFRGSGRLESSAINAAEETSYYITLALTHEWGCINRLQTIALVGAIAGMYRVGLYICWKVSKACPGKFNATSVFDASSEAYASIPFIRVFDDPSSSDWRAACNNQHWCLGHFESQCQVDMGLEYLWSELQAKASREHDTYMTNTLLPAMQDKLTSDFCWGLINVNDALYKRAFEYIADIRTTSDKRQVAFHVRRGDHKYMNCVTHVEKQADNYLQIQKQWEKGDMDVEALGFKC